MRTYQVVLPLLAIAFTMTVVDKTAAESQLPIVCPAKIILGCSPCYIPHCSDIANPPKKDGCICKGYYWQDYDCVPASQCKVECPDNMVYQACAKKPLTCAQLNSIPKDLEEECEPRCVCKPGYILAKEGSKKCIPKKRCMLPGY